MSQENNTNNTNPENKPAEQPQAAPQTVPEQNTAQQAAAPLSRKEQKKMVKLQKAKARTTEDWMKREKKIIIIFSIVCAVLFILMIIGFATGGSSGSSYVSDGSSYSDSSDTEAVATGNYEEITADELIDALEENAAAAKDKYVDRSFAITGKVSNIDNDCDYIDLEPTNDDFTLYFIQCYTTTEDQKAAVKQLKNGQTLTVKGTISDVGEVLGYEVIIDSIES